VRPAIVSDDAVAALERRSRFESLAADVFDPLQRYLRRRARPADAADVLGDTLLVVWRRLDDVPTDDPLPWCYGVARRCLANHRRGADRQLRLVDRVRTRASGLVAPDPQDSVERRDPDLEAAIDSLSEAEAEIVRLWAWEQLEPREIATVLDTTANAVSVALSRAKRKLADRLDRQDHHRAGQEPDDTPTDRGRS
jgi:RNA polymerase sigma-70 factor (ECF subfamily)